MKKVYSKPSTSTLKTDSYQMMVASGNILHDTNTQRDHQGPATGGDESSDGGDLEAAKGTRFHFNEE